ncbi:hypothetical protein [Oscillatoria acuminata]|nr:hypothetical protein [Oscillatoria acuminata]
MTLTQAEETGGKNGEGGEEIADWIGAFSPVAMGFRRYSEQQPVG